MGQSILEKIKDFRLNYDNVRKFLMHEPRGHYDMYGAMQVVPDCDKADVAFLFMHNEGFSTMCGHAVIALGRYCIDNGLVKAEEPETLVNIQCPCGLVPTYVSYQNGKSGSVRFHSVPSFMFATGLETYVPMLNRKVSVDIAYGGAFYCFVSSDEIGIDMGIGKSRKVINIAQAITDATKAMITIDHPDDDDLAFLYGTIIVDKSRLKSNNSIRQMTVFADCELDRSPTGSGTSAHVALLVAKDMLELNHRLVFESAVNGSKFSAQAIERTTSGRFDAVTVEVSGNAYYTGKNSFIIEADDPFKDGFLVK